MAKILSSLILFTLLPLISIACSITSGEKKIGGVCVDMGGYQLYAKIFGKAAPVVIFDSGLGDDSTVWDNVSSQVSKFARVVIYDRAGIGKSDAKPGNKSTSSQDTVNALRLMLKKENIKPPYILVGHSRGGLNMQLFAQQYPSEVAGLVLIDSVSRDQYIHDPNPPKSSDYYREAITFDKSRMQVKNFGPFPQIPLIVLTATNHHQSKQGEILWSKWQCGLTQISSKAIQIFAWNSGHYIQKEQPILVIDAIYTVIQLIKKDDQLKSE